LLWQAADGFSGHFLHLARYFFGPAFYLIFVNTHDPALLVFMPSDYGTQGRSQA
jgi:hypothetical protein